MASRRTDRSAKSDNYQDEREAARQRLERRRAASLPPDNGSRRGASAAASSGRSRARLRGDERIDPLAHSVVGAPASALTGGIHIPRWVIFGAGIAILVGLFAGVSAIERSCSPQNDAPVAVEVDGGEDSGESQEQPEQADFSLLPASAPADCVESLQAKADDERIVKIVNGAPLLLDAFGEATTVNLLELAAQDDAAIDFVAGLPENYPSASAQPFGESVEKGTVPLLFQWDERWGYVDYCAGPIGTTGCCPTSLSMVYMGLTGKTDKTPADMAAIATSNGYAEDGQGTYANFLTEMAGSFGLQCEKFTPSTQNLLTYLESGYVVICNVGPGDFTDSGHFFVATGLASDGTVKINDPYSSVTSATTWSPDRIANQSIGMYAFRV
ncbi:MAG: C39 family peptidase [Slackia sp.]|nr:C39 family peptidase [Slackia sp.]